MIELGVYHSEKLEACELARDFKGSPLVEGKRTFRVELGAEGVSAVVSFELAVDKKGCVIRRSPKMQEVCEALEKAYWVLAEEGGAE